MSRFLMILSLASAAATFGCASSHTNVASNQPPVPATAFVYEPSTAAALAFDPPIAMGLPMPSFDRDGRAPAAFVGYQQQETAVSYSSQRDEIRVYNDSGMLERRAYTDRTSVITR